MLRPFASLRTPSTIVSLLPSGQSVKLPRSFHHVAKGAGQMLHEVPDSALATAQMEQHTRPHDSPSQSGSPADRGVGIGNIHNTLMNEIDDLPIHGGLQPIGEVPDHLFADVNWF